MLYTTVVSAFHAGSETDTHINTNLYANGRISYPGTQRVKKVYFCVVHRRSGHSN